MVCLYVRYSASAAAGATAHLHMATMASIPQATHHAEKQAADTGAARIKVRSPMFGTNYVQESTWNSSSGNFFA